MAENLKKAKQRQGLANLQPPSDKLTPGTLVMIKNHVKGPFDPKYVGDFRIVKVKGQQYEIQPSQGGTSRMVHMSDVKYVLPAQRVIDKIPDYESFGRPAKLRLNPQLIPDLNWTLSTTNNTVFSAVTTHLAQTTPTIATIQAITTVIDTLITPVIHPT